MEKKIFEDNYTWLLDYQERSGEFFVGDIGCGMVRYRSRPWGNKGLIVADKENRLAYMLVMPDGELTPLLREEDFDWPAIETTGHAYEARCRKVDYRFDIDRYADGVALVTWMLHPDGSYYADEDGFGRTDDEEVNISAFIDRRCRVLVKFQPMDSHERKEELRKVALQRLEKQETNKLTDRDNGECS